MQRAAILLCALATVSAQEVEMISGLPHHPKDSSVNGVGTMAICLEDNSKEAKCYQTTEPKAYNKARAVLRILKNGRAHCTGWLVGSEGHVMTNHHCVSSQSGADRLEFEVMAEGTSCSQNCKQGGACSGTKKVGKLNFIQAHEGLDYALLQLQPADRSLSQTQGYLQLRASGPVTGEAIYIGQHPAGWGKRIALVTDSGRPATITGQGITRACSDVSVSYDADTQGGSSGSPVLSYNENVVVALHNCGGCSKSTGGSNHGTGINLVVDDLKKTGQVPRNGLSTGGPVPTPKPTPPPATPKPTPKPTPPPATPKPTPPPATPKATPPPAPKCLDYAGVQCNACLASNNVCYQMPKNVCNMWSSYKWCA